MDKLRPDFLWRMLQVYLKEGSVLFLFLLSVAFLLPAELGLYGYVTAFTYFFILIGDFGIAATTAKLVAEKSDEEGDGIARVFTSALAAVVGLSALSVAIAFLVGRLFLAEHAHLLIYAAPTILLAPLVSFFDGYHRGLRQFKLLSFVSLGAALAFMAASVVLVANYGLVGALLAQNVFYAAFLIGALCIRRGISFRFDRGVAREVARYSLIVGVGSIGYFLFTKIDVIVLGKFGYLAEAGYYELVTKIFSVAIITFSVFGQVIAPLLIGIRNDHAALVSKIRAYRRLVIVTALGGTALAVLAVPIAIRTFLPAYYTPEFLTGFFILAFLLPFDLWAVVQRQGMLVPLGMAGLVTVSTLVGGIMNVILDIAFIAAFGFVGVFVATAIVHIGVLAWQDTYLRRKLRAA